MKNNKPLIITLICLISIVILLLITFLVFSLKGGLKTFRFSFNDEVSTNLLEEKEYENNFSNIKINVNSADIEIKKSDNNIKTILYGNQEKLKSYDITNNDNTLNINVKNKNCTIFCLNIKSRVVVYIPENYDKNITIKNNYGDIEIESFDNAKISIEEDCGDVFVESAYDINVKNNYGDVKINKVNKAKIEESCGDVKVINANSIKVENNYGDIKIEKVNNHLDIEDDCGDIKIDTIILTENSRIINNMGDIEINNIKDVYIDAKTDLGSVKINNNYHKSDITLKIENDCGDIEVNN